MQSILIVAAVAAFQTTQRGAFEAVRTVPPTAEEAWQTPVLDLDAAKGSHPYLGLGGGMGDASCKLLSEMPAERRQALLEELFTEKGLNLGVVRVQVGANDYSTEVYTYDDGEEDPGLKRFSIARDRKWVLPVLREVAAVRPDAFFLASPWTPPGWMKTNGGLFGGWMKSEWLETYADYCTKFVTAYRDEGIDIRAFTVQNEPECQRGGSPTCLWHPEQEAKMAKLLRSRFNAAGLASTRVWLWDHNYDGYRRVIDQLKDPELVKAIDAVAWHPYCGEPEMMERVRAVHPDIPFHQTEFGPNVDPALGRDLAFWGKTILGALRHGCSSFFNFCLALDPNGYPNTSQGLGCGGFVELDTQTWEWQPSAQYLAFRHVSPFVERGAKILNCAWNPAAAEGTEALAFENPDGTKVVVFVVPGENPQKRQQVQFKADGQYHLLSVPAHSITTFVLGNK